MNREEINHVAALIVKSLKEKSSVFMNIQIAEERSQYDILFSYNFISYGNYQRGILATDLIISVIGFGSFGFKVKDADTDPGYYSEKLGVHSEYLSDLFNKVRKLLKNN